ncbi:MULTISPECIES: RHS repeat-associated core domain-containing protein [unclassified Pseudomonas]|uniref:RHS repeat-associated core domain-containing protein n=1 Tax=unclassified Pseudomonas TaxID=196821 RepID=UPI0002707D42|nr:MULTISPECIES: RHS repeat-associated core domain-containing protein [unclassified Pseudomonas]EJM84400.1 RHS repeat-associated core domain protein-containing protein [Pseudomonas sp. GM67]MBD9547174.1 RHS repeat protein [Pseudomonas sp. PDM01]
MTHANTPAIAVIDSRGLGVRAVAYHRRDNSAAESCITQQVHDVAGRAVLSRDPRLFRLHQAGQSAANQISVFSLSGALLLSENSDAGWRLGLLGEDGQGVEGWDQKLTHSRLHFDGQRRPIASFENAHGEAQRCIARFAYAAASADESLNLCGQLIRQDDTAGTLHYLSFGIGGTPLQHSRTFVEDPQWSVDWPATESERDGFLEDDPAITRLHCNAVGDPIRQTDAKGNTQAFIQTRAAELKEVRLTLAGQTEEKTLVSDIRYNAFGQVERQRAGNGVVSCATFRPEDGRLEHLKAYVPDQPAFQDLTYEYDAAGNITGLTDTADPTRYHRNQRIEHTHRYRYDSLYRLIAATGRQLRNASGGPQLPVFQCAPDPGQLENYSRIYTYDAAGNLEVMQHQADSASRTERTAIAASSNRSLPQKTNGELPDDNDIAAGYDLNGNRMTLQPGQDLLWNLRNQLRQVDRVVREDKPHDTEIYLYDGSGQRLRKIRQAYTGTLTRIHETRYLPGVEIRSCADEILHVITVEAGRGKVQVLHWEKKPASGIPQDPHRYSFTDHLKSSTVELDEAARLITWESYYPYGGTCWWAGRSKLEASYKTIRYSGQERDATGLYYYGFRYYMPWCQRWLSADPAGVSAGLNLYAMVSGNPIRHVDMQGLVEVDPNRLSAASAAGMHRFAAAAASFTVQLAVRYALELIEPNHEYNLALHVLASSLEGAAAGYTGYGLTKSAGAHDGVASMVAATAGIGFTIPVWMSEQGLPPPGTDPELHRDAIGRIASVIGGLTYQLTMDAFTAGPEIKFNASASFSDKFKTAAKASIGYAGARAGIGALNSFLPAPISGILNPVGEYADGFLETYMKPYPSETTDYSENTQAALPSSWKSTFQGAVTRSVGGSINRFLGGLISSDMSSVARGALGNAIGFFTEFRALATNQMKKGFIKDSLSPAFDIESPSSRRSSTTKPSGRGYWEGSLHLDRLFREA